MIDIDNLKINSLMVAYWPESEPKIVIIKSKSYTYDYEEDNEIHNGYILKEANTSIITGAKKEYLKEFNEKEFNKAVFEYKIKKCKNDICYYEEQIKKML